MKNDGVAQIMASKSTTRMRIGAGRWRTTSGRAAIAGRGAVTPKAMNVKILSGHRIC